MKIIFFTNKSMHGLCMLEQLKKNNISIEAIIIDENTIKLNRKDLIKHKIRSFIPTGFLNQIRKLRGLALPPKRLENSFYKNFSSKVIAVGSFNSKKCELYLKSVNPDLIVLGGARIIKARILDLAKIGVLNAHPGLLPTYRGVDVIRWALYNKEPLGVTVHFVNPGVDTGEIIVKKEFEVENGDTIKTLKQKAVDLAATLMSEVVLSIIKDKKIDTFDNPLEGGKQYYKMPLEQAREVDLLLETYGK